MQDTYLKRTSEPKPVPEDACENWRPEHREIAAHETDIGDLCDTCFEVYRADGIIDEDGRMVGTA